jgi:hypothetical protein
MEQPLHRARLAEAAHFDAVLEIRDAQTLRLQVLKDDMTPIVAGLKESGDYISLALVPDEPPRLWIDLTSYVVMAPDPRTYRLVQDTSEGHQVLAETTELAEMVNHLKMFIAQRTVARQRALLTGEQQTAALTGKGRHSTAALILAWLAGFSLGVLALLAVGIMMTKTPL